MAESNPGTLGVALVVDDDTMARAVTTRLLSRLQVEDVITTGDGVEAIDAIDKAGGNIAAAFIDIDMPRMHGLKLLKLIRSGQTAARPDLPCFMLTGHAGPQLMAMAIALDANGLVEKPVRFDTLTRLLDRVRDPVNAPPGTEVYRDVSVPDTIEAVLSLTPSRVQMRQRQTSGDRKATPVAGARAGTQLASDLLDATGYPILPAGTILGDNTVTLLNDLVEIDPAIGEIRSF